MVSKESLLKFLDGFPWGVVAWITGILVFYLTLGIWGAHFVFAQVNGQTGQVATIFDSWWQVLMFVADILIGVLFLGAIGLYVRKKVLFKGGKANEKVDA